MPRSWAVGPTILTRRRGRRNGKPPGARCVCPGKQAPSGAILSGRKARLPRQKTSTEGLLMPSPFPGMDPYLEQFWGDIHARLIIYGCDQLQGHLPQNLRARVQERVFVDAPETGERDVYPDLRVVERGRGQTTITTPRGEVAVAQPLILHLTTIEPVTETFIEIIDIGSGRRVVTVIEVLSPANKRR